MKCLICKKHQAVNVAPFGYLPCKSCQARQRKTTDPGVTGEITTDAIREDRKVFKKDLTQPFRDGHLAKEYVEAYPERVKKMIEEKHITKEEVKKAKDVWGLDYYKKE